MSGLSRTATRAQIAAYEVAHGTIACGTTVRMDHADCVAGRDGRSRLYVTRKISDSGRLADLCYCHNCGLGGLVIAGVAHAGALPAPASVADAVFREESRPLELPAGLVPPGTSGFPQKATEFLASRVGESIASVTGLGYDPESGRLLLPIYELVSGLGGVAEEAENLIGWQARRLWGSGPKYLTVEADECGDRGLEAAFYLWDEHPPTGLVLVEDWLSAVHVAKSVPGAYVVPLFRFKIAAERLARLRKRHHRLFVWLDNDKPEVIEEAAHIRALWRALGGVASAACPSTDPKNVKPEFLCEAFTR